MREELRQSRMALDQIGGEYLPSVDLNARYYHDDPDMSYDQDRENWVTAVMFSWNFFSGFSTQADSRKASAKIQEIHQQR